MKRLYTFLAALLCLTGAMAARLNLYTADGQLVENGQRLLANHVKALTNPLGNVQYLFLPDLDMAGDVRGNVSVTVRIVSATTTATQPMTLALCQGGDCVEEMDGALAHTFLFDPADGDRQALDLEYRNAAFPGSSPDEGVPTATIEMELTIGYADSPDDATSFTLVMSNDAQVVAGIASAEVVRRAAQPFSLSGGLLTPAAGQTLDIYSISGCRVARTAGAVLLAPGTYVVKAQDGSAWKTTL